MSEQTITNPYLATGDGGPAFRNPTREIAKRLRFHPVRFRLYWAAKGHGVVDGTGWFALDSVAAYLRWMRADWN